MPPKNANSNFDAVPLPGKIHVGLLSREKTNENLHGLLRMILTDAEDAARDLHVVQTEQSLSSSLDWAISYMHPLTASTEEEEEGSDLNGINFMLVHDLAGVTIVCNDRYKRLLNHYGISENCSWAPCTWIGYEMMVTSGGESHRIISHVSTLLSDSNVSILNYSTFRSDYILVQEHQKSVAEDCFAKCAQYGVGGMIKQMGQKAEDKKAVKKGDKEEFDACSGLKEKYSAFLRVLEAPLMLSYCTAREDLTKISLLLIKQVLNNLQRGPSAQNDKVPASGGGNQASEPKGAKSKESTGSAKVGEAAGCDDEPASASSHDGQQDFFWAYLSIAQEITFIHDSVGVSDFPQDTVHQWSRELKAVKLCGRDIPFNATGIVKTMMKPYEVGVELVNISTYKSNVSLVAMDSVKAAVDRINEYL